MQKDFSKKSWIILLVFGLIGQIAWSVENMYFNLFVFEEISPNLNAVTLMVQLSGVVATLSTLIAGTLSDKLGNRRKFISIGYLIWGITVGIFGYITPENISTLFSIDINLAISVAITAVVVGDCVMTLIGSSANDAAFNAWVTDNTEESYRGKVESVLSALPLIALLIVAGGFGMLVEGRGYQGLFLSLGIVITVCGLFGLFYIKDSPRLNKNGSLKDIVYGFKPSVIKAHKPLYIIFLLVCIYSTACQIYMPYMIIYMKTYLSFTVIEYSVVFGFAIIAGAIINILLGKKTDKTDKVKVLTIAIAILSAGLIGMYFAKFESKIVNLILFGVFGLIMITGYILVSALTSAMVRDNTPIENAGKLQGIRMIFGVLIPMIVGPMIGNGINALANIPLPDAGADAMTTSYIPAPEIFLVAGLAVLLMYAIIPWLNKTRKSGRENLRTVLLSTDYPVGETPHEEHPTPQSERETYLNLNGKWNFQKLSSNGETVFESQILVPFSPESINSGIENGFKLNDGESLLYSRAFTLPKNFTGEKTVLHFGAVDSECTVKVNGVTIGSHQGGFTPFSFDISSYLTDGENSLEVACTDNATRNGGVKGKQHDTPYGLWYTAHSGIWQTVWLENMPADSIGEFKITPLKTLNQVKITTDYPKEITLTVFDGETQIIKQTFVKEVTLTYGFKLWSPEEPNLYDIILENGAGDKIKSYFGVRSFGQMKDSNGIARLTLNGKPYFFNGLLDQGYWSDGLLTYPSDKAIIDELTFVKKAGYNTLRKHIKVEPMRWYYHCDRLGIAVWQDFVNAGEKYNFHHVATLPFLGIHHNDSDYKYFAMQKESSRQAFLSSMRETLSTLYNTPSIAVWVVFNEGWGQFDSEKVTEEVLAYDDTRIIDSVSGWHDQGQGKTTLKSLHTYYTKLKVPKDSRPVVLSEFGGYSIKVAGNVFSPDKEFGYKKFKTQQSLINAVKTLYLEKVKPLISQGLCGAIYTQVSDVEEEINGLLTYDRKVTKIPAEVLSEINAQIYEESKKISY